MEDRKEEARKRVALTHAIDYERKEEAGGEASSEASSEVGQHATTYINVPIPVARSMMK